MKHKHNLSGRNAAFSLENQPCVRAIRNAPFNPKLKKELEEFIKRNTLPDCGLVSPNCLKAHMIKKAKDLKIKDKKISGMKSLFRAKLGYDGYYLDSGKLRRV
jgi:hypothetical protein